MSAPTHDHPLAVRASSRFGTAWWGFLVAVTLLGAGLRLTNLEGKPYWFNEVFTSLKMSGWDEHRDANPALYTGAIVSAADVQRYQRLRPGSSAVAVAATLARKDVKWPPGYSLLARAWATAWGSSPRAMRSLPALLSLLAFPALYWLCRELFARRDVAWTALALHAVSPLFLQEAQSARAWGLTDVLVLTVTAVMLWALRRGTAAAWAAYGLLVSANLWVNPASLLLLAVHAVYMVSDRVRRQALRQWTLAAGGGLLSFAPWAALIVWNFANAVATSNHLRVWPGLGGMIDVWTAGLLAVFVVPPDGPLAWLMVAALVALVIHAAWFLARVAPPAPRLLVLLLIASALVCVVLPDVVFHTQVSSRARYLLITWIGMQLAVAYLLAVRAEGSDWRAAAWQAVAAGLLLSGSATCIAAVRADTWWGLSAGDVVAGRILARAANPLVLTKSNFGTLTPLTYEVAPETPFILFGRNTPLVLPPWDGEIFAYRPAPELAEALRRYGVLRPACELPDTPEGCFLQRLERP